MNKVILIGNLTRDCELRYSQSGVGIANFTLAVSRRFKNAQGERETDFINVKCFKQLAELCANALAKGNKAAVTGSIQISSYTDKDGNKKYSTDVIADEVEFLSPKNSGNSGSSNNASSIGHEVSFDDSSDIPF
ncbi:MAG: single-stranded DNA-binding protein [Desulfitobacterium hafniense]|nr:single-stranded DNA-binding protein [Desulfitobacterium hafniense]